jgi:hypothetical protein
MIVEKTKTSHDKKQKEKTNKFARAYREKMYNRKEQFKCQLEKLQLINNELCTKVNQLELIRSLMKTYISNEMQEKSQQTQATLDNQSKIINDQETLHDYLDVDKAAANIQSGFNIPTLLDDGLSVQPQASDRRFEQFDFQTTTTTASPSVIASIPTILEEEFTSFFNENIITSMLDESLLNKIMNEDCLVDGVASNETFEKLNDQSAELAASNCKQTKLRNEMINLTKTNPVLSEKVLFDRRVSSSSDVCNDLENLLSNSMNSMLNEYDSTRDVLPLTTTPEFDMFLDFLDIKPDYECCMD